MMILEHGHPLANATLAGAVERAARAIPPAWPLAATVAVNPFLGQAQEALPVVASRLRRAAGASLTPPLHWFAERIAAGQISDQDLAAALANADPVLAGTTVEGLKRALAEPVPAGAAVPTIAELAAEVSGIDWPALVAERIGAWAAARFDLGQAFWAAAPGRGAYASWRSVATHDLSPEILGLPGFARHVADAPEHASEAIARAVARLGLPASAWESCFHRLLMTLGGWAQHARYLLWQAELAGGTDTVLTDLLAIRLVWEEALFERHAARIGGRWQAAVARHAEPLVPLPEEALAAVLQEALERSAQRALAATLAGPLPARAAGERPLLQAVFCIDVRSEVFRRALEGVDPAIRTHGFAGFFGIRASHRGFASDVAEARLPVLLAPAIGTRSVRCAADPADRSARLAARTRRAWGRFRLAAVSSFSFVEASGPLYVAKLLRDALALRGAPESGEPKPLWPDDFGSEARIGLAEGVLRAMSLASGFAPLVLLVGHGAQVVNNPHASALQCGACGGHSGEVNARLLATLLNDAEVRAGLRARGIEIPADTLFLGALHDTTSDQVALFAADHPTALHRTLIECATGWLAQATRQAAAERALRLPGAGAGAGLARRGRDWSELRPEWGLAGCQAFIAAPRARTAGRDLAGRAFLHDYDWRLDPSFAVLEGILTAPVVVASWISLQYYASTVAPAVFGSGNKLLHNVIGGIGVVEGNGGTLRAGLPWQSVHDGERWIHEPLRLSVCVEAPRDAIAGVLERHPAVRALFDNRWLYLFALDDDGRLAWRYTGDLGWGPP